MTTSVISQMQSFQVLGVPWEKFLGHIFEIYLVNNQIELMNLGKNCNLKLATPCPLFANQFYVVINRSIILNEELVVLLVLHKLLDNAFPEAHVHELSTIKLISQGPEQTVAIATRVLDPETFLGEFDLELGQVLSLFAQHRVRTVNFVASINVIFFTAIFFLFFIYL